MSCKFKCYKSKGSSWQTSAWYTLGEHNNKILYMLTHKHTYNKPATQFSDFSDVQGAGYKERAIGSLKQNLVGHHIGSDESQLTLTNW